MYELLKTKEIKFLESEVRQVLNYVFNVNGVRDRLQLALRVFTSRSLSAALATLPIIAIIWIDSQELNRKLLYY
uniref:Uncharacterized protein n=1 Tax=Glossina palpalis gambiensis TaxID=67801 RepID=A0A1B0C3Z5_9MUSC